MGCIRVRNFPPNRPFSYGGVIIDTKFRRSCIGYESVNGTKPLRYQCEFKLEFKNNKAFFYCDIKTSHKLKGPIWLHMSQDIISRETFINVQRFT